MWRHRLFEFARTSVFGSRDFAKDQKDRPTWRGMTWRRTLPHLLLLAVLLSVLLLVTFLPRGASAQVAAAPLRSSFISAGLQFPFRYMYHENQHTAVSHLDGFSSGDFSWDGSVGHYLEAGRFFTGNDGVSPLRCGLKGRADFDFRSDHDVEFEADHELEVDLSIASFVAMGECERDLDADLAAFLEVGAGFGLHVNGIKYKREAGSRTTDIPQYITDTFAPAGANTYTAVKVDFEPAVVLGAGLAYDLTDTSSFRFGLQYRYMGENLVYVEPIHEASMAFGIRTQF